MRIAIITDSFHSFELLLPGWCGRLRPSAIPTDSVDKQGLEGGERLTPIRLLSSPLQVSYTGLHGYLEYRRDRWRLSRCSSAGPGPTVNLALFISKGLAGSLFKEKSQVSLRNGEDKHQSIN